MKRSISPDSLSSARRPLHHSQDDDDDVGAEGNSYILPYTPSDDHYSFLPVSQPIPTFNYGPAPVSAPLNREKYLADAWELLKPAIKIILDDEHDKSVDIPCTKIYMAVKRACFADPETVQLHIFDLIEQECEPHLASVLQSLAKQISDDPSVLLPLVYNCWLDFRRKMLFVSDLAMYLRCNEYTLWDGCQKLFHKQLSMTSQLQHQVITGILGLITDERRSGKAADNTSHFLKNLMDMFHGLSKDVFEKPFLDSTSKFYAEEAEKILQQPDISNYLKYVEGVFHAERKKCREHYFFFAGCCLQLPGVLERQLLEAHLSFLEEGFKLLMDESLIDDLGRMYRLFSRADYLLDYIDRSLRSYILAKGEGARQEGSLHGLHTSIDKIWRRCFFEDELLDKTIRDCFERMGLNVPV
ncbi:PREDICTED: cullin-like protein 5 [Camelina sativa]|uniref:Cullin-like protein 5 n=1 Tax=Camelina sativa TaxID=90675 RepID=A0ABM0WB68_CAMSA|nr:PREDICTED: cullin-like protein 5 [Camelina sativa]